MYPSTSGDRVVAGSDGPTEGPRAALLPDLSRDFSATRDQVLDALWPELDPEVAVNSLNQTLYFLRRVFEEDYVEDLSPGYVHHDSDVVWLDEELVGSRHSACPRSDPGLSMHDRPQTKFERLVEVVHGRFALDFEYEEWAAAYRDSLHASYLEIVERAVRDDFERGSLRPRHLVARRALEVDPLGRGDRGLAASAVQGNRGPRSSSRAVRALRAVAPGRARNRAADAWNRCRDR